MYINHHRNGHVLPIARFLLGLTVAVSITGACVYYNWCRNEIDATGRGITESEGKLTKLRSQIETAKARIARFSSTATLQQRHHDQFFKLDPIAQLEPSYRLATDADDDAVRPIANTNRSRRP